MRLLKTLILLFLLPTICRASPWDSHSFWDERSEQMGYWVGSVVVMVILLSVHLIAKGASVENKHDPKATAHKVRNATRVLAMMATCVSVFCWLFVLDQFEWQTILVYTVVYVMVFVFYARARAKRHAQHLPDDNKATDENHGH